jgi:hypothetical protein
VAILGGSLPPKLGSKNLTQMRSIRFEKRKILISVYFMRFFKQKVLKKRINITVRLLEILNKAWLFSMNKNSEVRIDQQAGLDGSSILWGFGASQYSCCAVACRLN